MRRCRAFESLVGARRHRRPPTIRCRLTNLASCGTKRNRQAPGRYRPMSRRDPRQYRPVSAFAVRYRWITTSRPWPASGAGKESSSSTQIYLSPTSITDGERDSELDPRCTQHDQGRLSMSSTHSFLRAALPRGERQADLPSCWCLSLLVSLLHRDMSLVSIERNDPRLWIG